MMGENMEKFEERQIRMDQKLDYVIEWVKDHKTEHMRTRLTIWGCLMAALIGIVIAL